jgi:polyisoprenoid-binding protein YceI
MFMVNRRRAINSVSVSVSVAVAVFVGAVVFSPLCAWAEPIVELRVGLFPAGSFVAKSSKVKGHAEQNGNEVSAKNITVPTGSFDSGIGLRNTHMKKRFNTDQHPEAVLLEASGKDGKGKGKLQVNGITKEVNGTYKIIDDKELEATFRTKASEFDIKDVAYMGVGMEDELEVFVRVPVKKAGAASAGGEAPTGKNPPKKKKKK